MEQPPTEPRKYTSAEMRRTIREIMRADQSDAERSTATQNLARLKTLEPHLDKTDLGSAPLFWNTKSVTLAHIAQQVAFGGGSEAAVLRNLQQAQAATREFAACFEEAKKNNPEDTHAGFDTAIRGQSGWLAYLQGTEGYFRKDPETIRRCLDEDSLDETNRRVLTNLLRGLEEAGDIDYPRDYSSAA